MTGGVSNLRMNNNFTRIVMADFLAMAGLWFGIFTNLQLLTNLESYR